MGQIAEELEARFEYLVGIENNWIIGMPQRTGQSCALYTYSPVYGAQNKLTYKTSCFLDEFTKDYDDKYCTLFNDTHTREERIWWFEEAVEDAKERDL